MTQAEQQAYEELLGIYMKQLQEWQDMARSLFISLECVETGLMLENIPMAQKEIDNARRHFETLKDAA